MEIICRHYKMATFKKIIVFNLILLILLVSITAATKYKAGDTVRSYWIISNVTDEFRDSMIFFVFNNLSLLLIKLEPDKIKWDPNRMRCESAVLI